MSSEKRHMPAVRAAISLHLIAALVLSVLFFLLIGSLTWKMDRGFDFTDQSFYLMLAQKPTGYELAFGLFAYAIHPLYWLAAESISAFNRMGAVILAGSGALLGCTMLANLKISWRDPNALLIVATSTAAPFFYYTYWIPTPSYNWLVLVAGLILASALTTLESRPSASAPLAALSFSIALFTRPLNVAAYGVIYLLGVLFAFRNNGQRLAQLGRVAIVGVGALVVLAAALPTKTIVDQINAYIAVFGRSHPNPFSIVDQQIEFLRSGLMWWTTGGLLILCMLARNRNKTIIGKWGELAAIGAIALLAISGLRPSFDPANCRVATVLGGGGFALLAIACRREANLRTIALMGLVGLIPWAATLGSAGRVCLQIAFFPGLSLVVLMAATSIVFPRSSVLVLVSLAGLYLAYRATTSGLASPYRLAAPLEAQIEPTSIGSGGTLKLDRRTREFVQRLQNDVSSRGFCPDDLAIDLSGEVPGVVFAIGGRMPVFPWIFAGYPSSDRLAGEYLRKLGPDRLARSWLIMGSGGHALQKQEWKNLGLDFTERTLVDSLAHPVDGSAVDLYAPLVTRAPCPRS